MIINIKALIVVLALAAAVFRLGKPIALQFSDELDFSRRRNVWLASITSTAIAGIFSQVFIGAMFPALAYGPLSA